MGGRQREDGREKDRQTEIDLHSIYIIVGGRQREDGRQKEKRTDRQRLTFIVSTS